MDKNYVAYYRVSTDKQGITKHGLDAQQRDVINYTKGSNIIQSFTEVESGKHNNRKELAKALELCKANKHTLVIASLDRLSRNSLFINQLLESAIDFVCCDMPDANPLTLRIMAAIAQHEREAISTRTKKALQSAKDKGVKLGSPNPIAGNKASIQARHNASFLNDINLINAFNEFNSHNKGYDYVLIKLSQMGFRTNKGYNLQKPHLTRLKQTNPHFTGVRSVGK